MIKSASKNIRLARRIIFLFLMLGSWNVKSQTYFFDNYSVDKGLANTKVYSILQDKEHLIWLGTPGGVSLFDGINIENYTTENGLAENGVWTIFQDSRGIVWFGHIGGGISRFNGKIFELVPDGLMKKDIYSFCENDQGQIWVTSVGSGAMLILNPGDPVGKLKYQQYKGKELSDVVFNCIRTRDNNIYFITDAGIKIYNAKAHSFDNFLVEGLTTYFQKTTMFEDKDRNLWFGTFHGGLYKYIRNEKRCQIYDIRDGLSSNWITSIKQDSKGVIWVGTWGGGITKIDGQKLKIFNAKNGLPNDNIYCIMQDAEGNILIGTSGQGLSIFKGEGFVAYADPKTLPDLEVWSILQDSENKIWFGTKGGISVYNPSATAHKFTIYTGDQNIPPHVPTIARFIKEDKGKNIWIGAENDGMFSYNRKTGRFRYCAEINQGLPSSNNSIKALGIDIKNNLWIGSVDGLYCFDIATNQLNRFGQAEGLAGNEISAIYIDKSDTKYIGSRGKGISIFTGSVTATAAKYPLLGNTTPTCITSDQSGNVWIGTEGQGLLCIKNGKILKRYLKKDGLLSDLINLVSIDDNGDLYAGSNLGLNKINAKGIIFTYTGRNGFTGIEAKNNAVFKDSGGQLWFGTAKGAICYNPKLDNAFINEPLTNIRKFTVNDKEHLLNQGIKLSYNQNRIVFDYSSVCLTNPDAVEYKVMLEGADIDWRPVNRQTSWSYPALPANHYKFKVIAKNNVGVWNRNPATFEFRINPPFYLTWWFITSCIFIGILGIVTYIKIRERNLIKEKQILEETVRERTAEVVEKNIQLAGKNKDITDSIVYASRIQNALLAPSLPFENTFTLFKPKDIVSGDFFWFLTNEHMEWMAAVDCTGHGVPGAFMSIIGNNSLNTIVKELGITKPAEILDNLDSTVIQTLHHYQHSNQIQDGMDITLISYDRNKRLLEFAGAFNPLWLVRRGEMIELPANRFPIGQDQERKKSFTNHEINIESGDTIYMFSDGYADQFGGSEGKKLKIGKFKELILGLYNYPMEEQKLRLENFLEEWKGNTTQIDDIMVIGRRFDF